MNNKVFVKKIYESIIVQNSEINKDIFQNTDMNTVKNAYWVNALKFYKELSEENKDTLFMIIKQIQVDTISNLFGVIDGVVTFSEDVNNFNFSINNEEIHGELQDLFLEFVEISVNKT